MWDAIADAIVSDRRKHEAHLKGTNGGADPQSADLLEILRSTGMVQLPFVLPADTLGAIRAHLDLHPVHRGPHIFSFNAPPTSLAEARLAFPMAGYRPDQLLRAPGLVDALNDPRLINLVEAYLGCVPTLYSVNAWHSFPANRPEMVNVQHFHRDDDDWRFCALFIYLTDVTQAEGPHQIVAGSHTLAGMEALLRKAASQGHDVSHFDAAKSFVDCFGETFSSDCERLFNSSLRSAVGPAGSMFLVNTIALHRGLVPRNNGRLMVWARFGLGANTNSADLEQGPLSRRQILTSLPDTPRNRYINRLLFEYDRQPDY
ncbi:MAG TPA: phytanoyl-CoA dioxygenase family protein [Reyranella sp.]|nr:phytanoyl-CoA dioxygenase family protein [Reyranella sp.]